MPQYITWLKIKEKVFQRDGRRCSKCGYNKRLVVHHKDGSGDNHHQRLSNNDLNNLVALCQSCHAKEHWQKAKNAGRTNIFI